MTAPTPLLDGPKVEEQKVPESEPQAALPINGEAQAKALQVGEPVAEALPVVARRRDIQRPAFTPQQINLITETFRLNLPNYKDGRRRELLPHELSIFLHHVKSKRLDPLANQICAVWRWDKRINDYRMTVQTQIDGFRLIAARTGSYAGSDDPVYVVNDQGVPESATVTVWRMVRGQRCAFTATARWTEYCPAGDDAGFMWRSKPFLMIGKCAEGLALRKAFPAELSGMYLEEELARGEQEPSPAPAAADATPKAPTRQERQGDPQAELWQSAEYRELMKGWKAKYPDDAENLRRFSQWAIDESGNTGLVKRAAWTMDTIKTLLEKVK